MEDCEEKAASKALRTIAGALLLSGVAFLGFVVLGESDDLAQARKIGDARRTLAPLQGSQCGFHGLNAGEHQGKGVESDPVSDRLQLLRVEKRRVSLFQEISHFGAGNGFAE